MSIDPNTLPEGAVVEANAKGGAALGPMTVRYIVRMRNNWRQGDPADDRTYVHRDDLPPTGPDAELVEKMATAMCDEFHEGGWRRALPKTREKFRRRARAALAVVREHEATR